MQTTAPGWHPPHCPNPNCPHHNANGRPWPYRKHGFYARLTAPHRIQRFTCRHCRRAFSSQTFSVTYWLRRPDVLPALLLKCVGGMANRQIARDLRVAPATVDGQLSRLGRHCLLFHRRQLRGAAPPAEIAFDGFETYEWSQYYPTHFHIAIEPDTSFFHHFTDSELRRKGRMTAGQKRRRRQLEERYGRPDPGAVRNDVTELLGTVLAGARTAVVRSDEHKAYPVALARLACRVTHQTVRARALRDARNPLWEINRTDRMVRHSQAGHARETLAWPKRRQRGAERLAVFLVWWNYLRRRWEKRCRASPAMLRGLTDRVLEVGDLLRERLFRSQEELPPRWAAYYTSEVVTRALPVNARHELRYAY